MRRKIATVSAVFVAGVVLGVVATSHVWITTSRLLREGALAEYQHEQLLYASRARKASDAFGYVVHSINAADAQAEIGFRWLQRSRAETYGNWFRFPWSSFPLIWDLDPYMASSPNLEVGRKNVESLYRSQAALALEDFGRSDLAAKQWMLAAELKPGWTQEEHREFATDHPWSFDDSYEKAYTESKTFAEFSVALERIRGLELTSN